MSQQKTTTYKITLPASAKTAVTVKELEAFLRKCPPNGIVSVKEGSFTAPSHLAVTKRKALDDE